jgi:hypothetical protein
MCWISRAQNGGLFPLNENEDANEKFKEISYAYKYLTEGE